MDTSDPMIQFDESGVCNHCRMYEKVIAALPPLAHRKLMLEEVVSEIKQDGKGKPYDCVMGVSGGVDSTYAAYLVKELGLRPIAIHLDNGWDSELAVSNIEKVLNHLGIELYTEVLNWDEFRDLQLAFLKASVPDAEIPTDHAITTIVYRMAHKLGLKFLISGTNLSTEAILPDSWTHGILDWRYIRSVHKQWGTRSIKSFPHMSFWLRQYYTRVKKIHSVQILNYIDYKKFEVMKVLEGKLGWRRYHGKHHESIYTRFFQAYILPKKFGIDKRRAHLSCLICAGEMTRAQALEEMKQDICPADLIAQDKEFVVKKLGLTEVEFDRILALPRKSYRDYPTSDQFFNILHGTMDLLRSMKVGSKSAARIPL